MVGIFTGSGTGFERGSGALLGASGLIGSSAMGRGGEQIFVNGANGNLLISRQDEFMVGRGPDVGISRTYNSLGNFSDENGDNWRQSTDRMLVDFTGTPNAPGSTITRRTGDGSVLVYRWRSGTTYENVDGAGAADTLVNQGSQWTWTDGATGDTEVYGAYGSGWRIVSKSDTSGNSLTYGYTGAHLTTITSADSGQVTYSWTGDNITAISTSSHGTTLTRAYYSYDSSNRLIQVTTDLTPEDGSTSDLATYWTKYTYVGTSKLVASIEQKDGSYVSFGYDGAGRIVTIAETESAGVIRTTTLGYGTNYTTITDPLGQVTRLDYAPTDLGEVADVGLAGVSATPGTIGGRPATTYTVQSSGYAWAGKGVGSVAAGDTVSLTVSLQAVGDSTTQALGLFGYAEGWMPYRLSTARIVSGPGTLSQYGGQWTVSGLSTTEPTRIEIIRTFSEAQYVDAFLYVDAPQGGRVGASLTIGDISVVKSSDAAWLPNDDVGNWAFGGLTRTLVSSFDGSPAYRYTASSGGTWNGVYTTFNAERDDRYSYGLTIQADGIYTSQAFGLYGYSSGWGANSESSARIVSGPGTLRSLGGGLWAVDGLSTTQPTRIEVNRTFDRAEGAVAYFYSDAEGGFRAGSSLIAGAPLLVRHPVDPPKAGLLTKITLPAAYAGAAQQVIQFAYDNDGDLVSMTDAAGATTTFTYDANKNLLTTTDALTHQVVRTYGSNNELLSETRNGSDGASASASHTIHYAYNSRRQLAYTVDAEGIVTRIDYDSNGLLARQATFLDDRYTGSYPIDQSIMDTWCAGLGGGARAQTIYSSNDDRGEITQTLQTSSQSYWNQPVSSDGYTILRSAHDIAGNVTSRSHLASGGSSATPTQYFVYDGLGRLIQTTDAAGTVTTITFDDIHTTTILSILATGLVRTSIYDKLGNLLTVAEGGDPVFYAPGGTAANVYDANGQVRRTTDATGRITYFVYDHVGRNVADVNQDGYMTEYRYDSDNRLVGTIHYTNAVSGTNLTSLASDALTGTFTELSPIRPAAHGWDISAWQMYDADGRLVEAVEGDGSVTGYTYDASDRLIATRAYYNKLNGSQLANVQAGGQPPILPVADTAHDNISRNFYDADGRLIAILDGEGYLSQTIYDAAGQKIEVVGYATATNNTDPDARPTWTLAQLLSGLANTATDNRSHFVYDLQGFLRFEVDTLNHVTEYAYGAGADVNGIVRSQTHYAGTIPTLASYTISSVTSALSTAGLTNAAGNRTTWAVYDSADRLAYAIDALGFVTGYTYDAAGHVAKTIQFATARATTALPGKDAMDTWAAGAGSTADRITRSYYNGRGELRFTVDAEGYVTRNDYDEAGRVVGTYRWDGKVTTITDTSTMANVAASVGGGYAGQTFAYDSSGRLTTSTDGEGQRHDYWYWGNGQLGFDITSLGTAEQAYSTYSYDQAGRVATRVDVLDATHTITTSYGYDGQGNQVSVTDGNNNTTTRTFDRAGQAVSETDAAGGTTYYQYDAFGQVVRTTDRVGGNSYSYYDQAGRLITTVDALKYITETSYTIFGEVQSVTRRANAATNTPGVGTPPTILASAAGATTSFEYDRLGRLTRSADAEGHYEQYTLDAFGNRVTVRNKLGGLTTNSFDRRGLLTAETLPMSAYRSDGSVEAPGVTNHFEYDSRGNRTKMIEGFGLTQPRTTIYWYDKADRLVQTDGDAVIDQSGASHIPHEYYAYNTRGNLIKTTDANGGSTFFYYDALDRKIAEISAVGTLSTYAYDANGNLTLSRVYGTAVALPATAGGTPPTVPTGSVRETGSTYDPINRITTSTIANVRQGAWDAATSAWTSTAPGNATTHYEYGTIGSGAVVHVADASGGHTYTYYDKLGRKSVEVDPEGYATRWNYDAEGNVVTERRFAAAVSHVGMDGATLPAEQTADRVTMFEYDKNGNRTKETRYNVEAYSVTSGGLLSPASSTSVIAYVYNCAGQVKQKTEATGEAVNYTYDDSGRLTQESRAALTEYLGAAATRPTVRYFYDGLGNLVRTEQGQVTLGGAATGTSRVTTNTYGAGGRLSQTTDALGNTRSYYYDTGGNVAAEKWNRTGSAYGVEGMTYQRDALGRVTDQAVYDINGSSWIQAGDHFTTAYNVYGEVAARGTNRSGATSQERFVYDDAGRLSGSNTGDGVWRYYFYDGAGHQTLILEDEGNTSFADLGSEAAYAAGATAALGNPQEGVVATINVVDKRGLVTQVRMPQREISGGNQSLNVTRTYNAFGEVASEQDARGNTTTYSYNNMGRVTTITHPIVTVVAADGSTNPLAVPVDHMFYDLSGRLVASDDANTHRTTRQLLAGTGYGGTEALVTREYHADGGSKTYDYDAYGELRHVDDELGRDTVMAYDALGRMVQLTHANGLVETYGYDQLGQQTSHANSLFVSSYGTTDGTETTGYDIMGRVSSRRAFGGDVTTIVTSWNNGLASGLGGTGGWTEATTYANGKTGVQATDQFGHQLTKTDLGGHSWTMTYDAAGRMTGRTGQDSATYSWYNTGLVNLVQANGQTAHYAYDASGNQVVEQLTDGSYTRKNATAQFDALGRMTNWAESGLVVAGTSTLAGTTAASLAYSYDAVGNIRRSVATFSQLNATGGTLAAGSQDYWYAFDTMNRVTTAKGMLVGGVIVRGSQGVDYLYDAAGQRVSSSHQAQLSQLLYQSTQLPNGVPTWWDEDPGFDGDRCIQTDYQFTGDRRETYDYNLDGSLHAVSVAQTLLTGGGNTSPSVAGMGNAVLTASYTTDLAGRTTHQVDYAANGAAAYDSSITFNARGQVWKEVTSTPQGSDTLTSSVENLYGTGTGYALGALVSSTTVETRLASGSSTPTPVASTTTTNTMAWWDGAVTASSSAVRTPAGGTAATPIVTTYGYGADGSLTSVGVGGTGAYTVTFTNDVSGQAIARDRGAVGTSGPHELWYRYGGKEVGYTGNNGTQDSDYLGSIASRTAAPPATPGPFRNGATASTAYADFDQSLAPINSFSQGGAGGSYEVHAGDTLGSIAAGLWGDSSLWYKLAEANGLGANAGLVEGQRLSVPAGVMKNTHNASTFNPYDPSEVIGDVGPAPSPAAKKNKCGAFGAIILVAVAVAVAAIAGPAIIGAPMIGAHAATGLTAILGGTSAAAGSAAAIGAGVIGGALAGVGGSIASQFVGLATGIQDKFDWKGVALAGISGGVGGGLGAAIGQGGVAGSKVLGDLVRGAGGNIATQGIGLVTGLQSKFDWAGVAVAGAVSMAVGATSRTLLHHGFGQAPGASATEHFSFENAGNQALSGIVGALAGGAARSLIDGSDFGDNVLAALPDVVGSTIGNALATRVISSRPASDRVQTADASLGGAANYPQPPGTGSATESDVQPSSDIVVYAHRLLDGLETAFRAFMQTSWLTDMASRISGSIIGQRYIRPIISGVGEGIRRYQARVDHLNMIYNNLEATNPGIHAQADARNAAREARVNNALAAFDGQFTAPFRAAGRVVNWTYEHTIGPGTLWDQTVTQPFYRTLGAIGDVLDPGAMVAVEQATESTPYTQPIAAGAATLRYLGYGLRGLRAATIETRVGAVAAESSLPTIIFSRAQTPGIANNIEAAIAEGHPSVLARLTGRDALRANRADALAGQTRAPTGYSLDEFPFASTYQGGSGSRVLSVPVREQHVQGGLLSSFYQRHNLSDGDPFRVLVGP